MSRRNQIAIAIIAVLVVLFVQSAINTSRKQRFDKSYTEQLQSIAQKVGTAVNEPAKVETLFTYLRDQALPAAQNLPDLGGQRGALREGLVKVLQAMTEAYKKDPLAAGSQAQINAMMKQLGEFYNALQGEGGGDGHDHGGGGEHHEGESAEEHAKHS